MIAFGTKPGPEVGRSLDPETVTLLAAAAGTRQLVDESSSCVLAFGASLVLKIARSPDIQKEYELYEVLASRLKKCVEQGSQSVVDLTKAWSSIAFPVAMYPNAWEQTSRWLSPDTTFGLKLKRATGFGAGHSASVSGMVSPWRGVVLSKAIRWIPPDDAARVLVCSLRDAARAVWALNAVGITHGDIKAANIVVDPVLGASLIDLGASVDHGSSSSLVHQWTLDMADIIQEGWVSPHYPPEICALVPLLDASQRIHGTADAVVTKKLTAKIAKAIKQQREKVVDPALRSVELWAAPCQPLDSVARLVDQVRRSCEPHEWVTEFGKRILPELDVYAFGATISYLLNLNKALPEAVTAPLVRLVKACCAPMGTRASMDHVVAKLHSLCLAYCHEELSS
jgi:hypothetical protein